MAYSLEHILHKDLFSYNLNTLNEVELIELAKKDRDAFALLYRTHYHAVGQYIFRRLGDAHVTEDLVAEVFLSALKALPRFKHRGISIRTWFYKIATNQINRWIRKNKRHLTVSLQDMADITDSSSISMSPSFESTRQVRCVMLALPIKYQTVLSLHYLEGLCLKDIACIAGCRLGTVKSRLSRGRSIFRDKLVRWRMSS